MTVIHFTILSRRDFRRSAVTTSTVLSVSPLIFSSLNLPRLSVPVSVHQPIAVTPQQIASLRQQQQQHSGSGPPPLLLAPRASVPNVQAQGQRIIQQGLSRVANVANNNVMVNIPQVGRASVPRCAPSPQGIRCSSASEEHPYIIVPQPSLALYRT